MGFNYTEDVNDIEFIRGRANQLIPPAGESAVCDVISNGLVINIYLKSPLPEEINAILPGQPAEIGLFEYRGVLILLMNFGDLVAAECPVHMHNNVLPEERPRTPGAFVVLTDLDTNIVQSVRFLSMRPSFWHELYSRLVKLQDMHYTLSKQKLLEEMAMEIPGNKWDKAVIRHKII